MLIFSEKLFIWPQIVTWWLILRAMMGIHYHLLREMFLMHCLISTTWNIVSPFLFCVWLRLLKGTETKEIFKERVFFHFSLRLVQWFQQNEEMPGTIKVEFNSWRWTKMYLLLFVVKISHWRETDCAERNKWDIL